LESTAQARPISQDTLDWATTHIPGQREHSTTRGFHPLRRGLSFLGFALLVATILECNPDVALSQTSRPHPHALPPGQPIWNATQGPRSKLTFRLYNYAGVYSRLLTQSENVAASVFADLGIETVWVDCPVPNRQSLSYLACQSDMGPSDLVLRILPRSMAAKLRPRDETLGSAPACPEREPACQLNIFYQRVDQLAGDGYRAERVLGYAIAHEAAHVLLGPGHSDYGIMRGQWSRDDLQRISWGLYLGFTPDQSTRLRDAVLRRTIVRVEAATGWKPTTPTPEEGASSAPALAPNDEIHKP
jgi:hypothetical protein